MDHFGPTLKLSDSSNCTTAVVISEVTPITIAEPEEDSRSTVGHSEADPLTPPLSNKATPNVEKMLQITDRHASDDESELHKKSCLSLPLETLNSASLPIQQDRRKLSVQGLIGLTERRRSSGGAFLTELTRKLSITNSEGFGSRTPGIGKPCDNIFYLYYNNDYLFTSISSNPWRGSI